MSLSEHFLEGETKGSVNYSLERSTGFDLFRGLGAEQEKQHRDPRTGTEDHVLSADPADTCRPVFYTTVPPSTTNILSVPQILISKFERSKTNYISLSHFQMVTDINLTHTSETA